jgi:hypothetical protein
MPKVNTENWSFGGYKNSKLKAFISFGADFLLETQKQHEIFFLTVTDNNFKEVFQQDHSSLNEAIEALNSRYAHWDWDNRRLSSDDGGCGTCAAH